MKILKIKNLKKSFFHNNQRLLLNILRWIPKLKEHEPEYGKIYLHYAILIF